MTSVPRAGPHTAGPGRLPTMAHFLEDLDLGLDVVAEPAPIARVEKSPKAADAQKRLEALEDEVLEGHLKILRDAGLMREITTEHILNYNDRGELPAHLVKKYGEEEAHRVFRVAAATWSNSKDAPKGLDLASKVVTGLVKAKAGRGGNVQLNIGIMMPMPVARGSEMAPQYPVVDVTDSDG